MTAFFLLFSKINQTYTYISNQYIRLIEMIPRVEKLSELYEKESRLVPGPLEPEQLEGRIELVDVSFTYPSRPGQQVLRWSGATSLVQTSPDTLLSLVHTSPDTLLSLVDALLKTKEVGRDMKPDTELSCLHK